MTRYVAALAACISITSACERPAQAGMAKPDVAAEHTPIVDSILPSGEALRRFQADLPRVSKLEGAAPSRDALVERFITGLRTGDTTSLRSLHVSKAEYGFVYFPTSVYSRKPYELSPDIAWMLSEQNSAKGLTRLTRRLGGIDIDFRGYDCGPPITEGENVFWRSCHASYADPSTGRPITKRLFGAILRNANDYKFLSYANDF